MRRTTGGIAALAGMLAAFAVAAPAQAGIYTVYACNAAGRQWDNRSWELVAPVNGIAADQDCAGDNNIGLNQTPGGRTADGAQASLQFLTPVGHHDRRLPPDQADHLPQPDAGRHAPLPRDHRARRHGDRGRRQLRRRHARQAQRPGPLVRLSGGQRGHGDRDRLAGQLPGARRIPGRRPQPDGADRVHRARHALQLHRRGAHRQQHPRRRDRRQRPRRARRTSRSTPPACCAAARSPARTPCA